jgi:hypothetical protein
MQVRYAILALFVFAALVSRPTLLGGQQASQNDPHLATPLEEQHPGTPGEPATRTPAEARANMTGMMALMKANNAKLDELVKKMNSATGTAKTDAIAELLTALVDDRRNVCGPTMGHMMSRMNMMGRGGNSGRTTPPAK